jgi:hypothetical protein
MTATIWRTCPSCGSSFEQLDDPGPQARLLLPSLPAGRLPRPPNALAPASTAAARTGARTDARTGAPIIVSSAASAPGPSGPAAASATTSARTGRTNSISSAGHRRTAPTASGPAPEAATT